MITIIKDSKVTRFDSSSVCILIKFKITKHVIKKEKVYVYESYDTTKSLRLPY